LRSRITRDIEARGAVAGGDSTGRRPGRAALRRALIEMRRALPEDWRRAADAAIARRLHEWLAGRTPGVIALWWPLPGEPDLTECFAGLAAAGWAVALPRVAVARGPLVFGRWQPGIEMVERHHRVKVPEPFELVEPSLVLAPCVGFDPRGWRLGYGGGYYDRTLAALRVESAGVAYDACELSLEPAPHDWRLDAIVTESRLLRCR
jgi:5,10-methenyltetrahydrofolate synthetase